MPIPPDHISPRASALGARLRAWLARQSRDSLFKPAPAPVRNTPWGPLHTPALDGVEWDENRLRAAQTLFGRGHLAPISSAELSSIAGLLEARRGARIALLGGGLGGLGTAIAAACKSPVIGFEQSQAFLDHSDQSRNGRLRSLDSITIRTEKSFDHVVIDGLGHRAGDIGGLLKPATLLLSMRGSLLVRTYVIADEKVREQKSFQRWATGETGRPQVMTRVELVRLLHRLGFRITDERAGTEAHVEAVDTAWSAATDLVRTLNGEAGQRALVEPLMREADHWRQRLSLIHKSRLQVIEILSRRHASDAQAERG